MDTTLRLSEPRELLALIPYQLGFQPTDSAVVVSLRRPRLRLGLVARVDLPDLADPEHGPQVARSLVGHLVADQAQRAVLVLYPPRDVRTDPAARRAVEHLTAAADHFLGVPDCWVVGPTGYYGLDCTDPGCCPPGGRPLRDLQSTQVGARMVLAGVGVAASRAELVRLRSAGPQARRSARRAAQRWRARLGAAGDGHQVHRWRREGLALWRAELERVAEADRQPDPNRIGRLMAALEDVLVRDAVLIGFVEGTERLAERLLAGDTGPQVGDALRAIVDPRGRAPDTARAAVASALLIEVLEHSVAAARAPALTLLAVLAWWQGDGARAGVLVDLALAAQPRYRLAELLAQSLAVGMPPGWLRPRGA